MIAQKLTDMKLRLETSRMLLYQVGWLRKQGKSAVLESAMAKLHISENWVQSCQDAIQIMGGTDIPPNMSWSVTFEMPWEVTSIPGLPKFNASSFLTGRQSTKERSEGSIRRKKVDYQKLKSL